MSRNVCVCMPVYTQRYIAFKNEGEIKMSLDKQELEKHGNCRYAFQEMKCSSSLNDYAPLKFRHTRRNREPLYMINMPISKWILVLHTLKHLCPTCFKIFFKVKNEVL